MITTRSHEVELTLEQLTAADHLLSGVASDRQVQTLGGYAGTGKTTLIRYLHEQLPSFGVCAYTGKAAHVLRRKGIPNACTIHSLIYQAREREWRDKQGKRHVEVVFDRRNDFVHRGLIIDEASMVGQRVYEDLCYFDVPLIFVGDHGQLPPVADNDFNLMATPDITLDEIHRNAGEIAHFANFVREGNRPSDWEHQPLFQCNLEHQIVRFLTFKQATHLAAQVLRYNQIICGLNSTRININRDFRHMLDLPPDRPVVGDRVMCLQNDRKTGVFNGMQGTIEALFGDEMLFESEGETFRVRFIPEQFHKMKTQQEWRDRQGRVPFDYAYAITCHKAQGDEFDDVLVLEQKSRKWDQARWCYTAASRARRRLTWVVM